MNQKRTDKNACADASHRIDLLLSAVVRLDMTVSSPNMMMPWQNHPQCTCSGSGVVIAGKHILTNAHNVTNATYISVHKNNDDEEYEASILAIDHDCDLALLTVKKNSFFNSLRPMELGDTPPVRSQVQVAGYPLGGTGLSITQGIISRIEEIPYAHSGERLLAAQLDAAINPGNSGGPVIVDDKVVGIAFQGLLFSSNIAYMIPIEIIRHFLKDVEDNTIDGFPTDIIKYLPLVNPEMRHYLKMTPEQTGIMVFDFRVPLQPGTLRPKDVLLKIDGYAITNNGHIKLDNNEFRSYAYAIQKKQIGEPVTFCVLRDGKEVDIVMPVARFEKLCKACRSTTPDYYILGGLLFMPFYRDIYDYLASAQAHSEGQFVKSSHLEKMQPFLRHYRQMPEDECVIMLHALIDKVNYGLPLENPLILEKINGVEVKNLRYMISLLDRIKSGFVELTFHGNIPIVIDIGKMRSANARILETYRIPSDRSKTLRSR